MFVVHLFLYIPVARLLLGTMLLACLDPIRLKYSNMTLLNSTLIFLASLPFMLCKSSASFPVGSSDEAVVGSDEAVVGSNTLYAYENRGYFSPGRSTPVIGKEGASC